MRAWYVSVDAFFFGNLGFAESLLDAPAVVQPAPLVIYECRHLIDGRIGVGKEEGHRVDKINPNQSSSVSVDRATVSLAALLPLVE